MHAIRRKFLNRILKFVVLTLLAVGPIRAQNVSFIDFNGNTAGSTPTTGNIASGSHCLATGDTISETTGQLTYVSMPSMNFTSPLKMPGCGEFPGATNVAIQRTMQGLSDTDKWQVNLTGGSRTVLSTGFWWQTDMTPTGNDLCDQMSIAGPETMYLQMQSNGSTSLNLTFEDGTSTNHGSITVSKNTRYWVTMLNTSGVSGGSMQASVYDTNLTLLGSISFTTHAGSPGGYIEAFGHVGSCGNTYVNFHTIYDNIIIDRTGSYPILPPNQALYDSVISPARAYDWSFAGVTGGIPTSRTQCGSTLNTPQTAAAINSALAACAANTYLLLGPGTFTFTTGGISFPTAGNVTLRGSGPTQTTLQWTSSGTGASNCQGGTTTCDIEWHSSDGTFPTQPPAHIYNVTAGLVQGSQQLTLSSGTAIVANSTQLYLDACDDGYTGATCTGSASVASNGFINQSDKFVSPNGVADDGPDGFVRQSHRNQSQVLTVTACNPACGSAGSTVVTLLEPIASPNWGSLSTPQVYLIQPNQGLGLESLTVDSSSTQNIQFCLGANNISNSWVKNVVFKGCYGYAFYSVNGEHITVQDSYFYNIGQLFAFNTNTGNASYAVRYNGGYYLIQNNICQTTAICVLADGPDVGSVVAHNFAINHYLPNDNLGFSYQPHARSDFVLYEGNVGTMVLVETTHATHNMITSLRNKLSGWESCGTSGTCGASTFKDFLTDALLIRSYNRYSNHIGNVLGTPVVSTARKATTSRNFTAIVIGAGNVAPDDSLVGTSGMLWGNYDTFTNANQFTTGEVPSALSDFPNPVPTATCTASLACPNSFYLTSKPAWFTTLPWPAIGPDVSGGNLGVCSGTANASGGYAAVPARAAVQCQTATFPSATLNAAFGGHANTNPAMKCFFDLGGVPDGTNSILAFDAATCYITSTPPSVVAPAPVIFVGNVNAQGQIQGGIGLQ